MYLFLPKILSLPDMSNSIETPIDIDFFGGIDISIVIDPGYPLKIDIGIDIDFLKFERLTLALALTLTFWAQCEWEIKYH